MRDAVDWETEPHVCDFVSGETDPHVRDSVDWAIRRHDGRERGSCGITRVGSNGGGREAREVCSDAAAKPAHQDCTQVRDTADWETEPHMRDAVD